MSKKAFKGEKLAEDISYEDSIRPQIFEHFIGQDEVKESISLYVKAANKRGESLDHVLIYGPPGLGKTTLSHIISNEMGAEFNIVSGAIIQKPSDLINTLIKIPKGGVLFIDEIHRMPKTVEEFLYPALEDCAIDIITGCDENSRQTERIKLNKFTVIGATTRAGMISSPLRARFGIDYRIEYYNESDLKYIAKRTASILGIKIVDNGAELIATGSRGTPRLTNRWVRRCRDVASILGDNIITLNIVEQTFKMEKTDKNGLDNMDRKILKVMVDMYNCAPVGIKALSVSVDEDMETIETVYEPYLIQKGYITRTSRGRSITEKGKRLVRSMK